LADAAPAPRPGKKQVRAISKIHRTLEFGNTEEASRLAAARRSASISSGCTAKGQKGFFILNP
jgi:hypothetical protein